MRLRIVLLAVIGLSSAGLAIIGWVGPQNSIRQAEAAAVRHHAVLVAARHLNAGSLLKPEDLTGADVSDDDPQIGAWPDTKMGRAELAGAMIRRSLAPHEVVVAAEIIRPGEQGFLAAVLRPGRRAISVGIDAVTGNSGLIWPGDHVDLILTQALDGPSTPPDQRISGHTVLHNVRVLAIDPNLVRGGGNATKHAGNNRAVTLEVSPIGAERTSVAVRLGKLSLVVVAADQMSDSPMAPVALPDTVTWGGSGVVGPGGELGGGPGEVSQALRQGVGNNKATIRVFQGANESKEYHF
jgi:pilus assembly protein CpaB